MMKKIGITFAFALPACFVLLALIRSNSRHLTTASFDKAQVRTTWENLSFQEIENSTDFRTLVDKIPIVMNAEITNPQTNGLYNALFNTFIGLNEGSYQSYRKFRTPTPSKLNPDIFNEDNRESLIKGAEPLLRPGDELPNDFEKYIELMFYRMNSGHGMSNYWNAVCITNATVSINIKNTVPLDLRQVAATNTNMGIYQPSSMFVPERDEKLIIEEAGKLLSATASFVINHTPPDAPYRIYIRYFWDPKYEKWVPSEYVGTLAGRRAKNILW